MIWCRFQKGNSVSYGIVEGGTVTAVEGDPFTTHRVTANTFPLRDVKLLVPVLPGTFYAIGSNYRNQWRGGPRSRARRRNSTTFRGSGTAPTVR